MKEQKIHFGSDSVVSVGSKERVAGYKVAFNYDRETISGGLASVKILQREEVCLCL